MPVSLRNFKEATWLEESEGGGVVGNEVGRGGREGHPAHVGLCRMQRVRNYSLLSRGSPSATRFW